MKLDEAKQILKENGYLVETWLDHKKTKYGTDAGWSGYTFKKPSIDRKYIRILLALLDGEKTKADVHAELGLPDPTSKEHLNYYTSVWQEMRKAGLVDFEKTDGQTLWFITPRGMDLLDEVDTDKIPDNE